MGWISGRRSGRGIEPETTMSQVRLLLLLTDFRLKSGTRFKRETSLHSPLKTRFLIPLHLSAYFSRTLRPFPSQAGFFSPHNKNKSILHKLSPTALSTTASKIIGNLLSILRKLMIMQRPRIYAYISTRVINLLCL